MAGLRTFRQDDFTGGLNLRADQFQLAQNESPRMLNVEIDPRGGVFSRGAMRRINTSPVSANWVPENMFPFYGNIHYIMLSTGFFAPNNGDVFYSTGGNFSSLAVPVSEEHGASFAPWGGTLYIATGHSTVSYSWDGTTKTALNASGPIWQNSYTTPSPTPYFPKAKHTVTHAGKVFVASTHEDGVAHPTRIRWSHPNNPTNWAAQDYIDINDGGQDITGLTVFNGHLVVFKHNAVFAVFGYDSDTFQVVEVSRAVGASTPHAICVTERGVYFFSYPDGLMLYNGNGVIDVFEPIRPAITNGYINPAAIDEVYVNYINRRVWVSLPYSEVGTETHPTTSFVYDPSVSQRGAWLQFSTADNKAASGGCTFIGENGATKHLIAHSTLPYVLAVDDYNSGYDNINGTELQFTSRYRTRWVDGGSYSQKKMFRRPDIIIKQLPGNSTLTIRAYGNYEEASAIKEYSLSIASASTGMVWGTSYWGLSNWGDQNTGSQITRGRSIGLAKSIQLEFEGGPGIPWGINSYTLKYNPRKVAQ